MACALLPAGVAAALPSPRRSAAAPKGQPNQVACTNQLHCKLPLSEPHRSWSLVGCCTCSGAQIVISGYWIGPDVEDGSGHVQAILQRIH
ncbi:uncharacterized protein LOC125535743 isoform X2 [Triticum urartu]|uniref:Uncharacterized protein n=1 Tax=Triticum urartu TaxID=4572 RepID=A0A8R7TDF4_TRIUA|nr:uncharacterized protein LOC119353369 isoform X3 [Triticum dicoccoides]XP_037475877.1 uncharacterized protein LOC119353369 isoform X3 [Triticum dicoccoides]XP_048554771.1 uncharacterized protein LOC125535743 isoform X2 [Triticum urartu]XP_048554772.1 uncharacterized protein LOC125535743 isoform X2 [Triticum urartu]